MRNPITAKLTIVMAFLAVFCVAYYVLFSDSFMHISIGSILARTRQLSLKKHLVILGLIPIYISLMIVGAAMLGIYIGSMLESFLEKAIRKPIKNQSQA